MPPSPSDPYRSRLLRSVLSQAQRWLGQGQESVRRVQGVASWSAQILLYPVYAVFQGGRWAGKQLGQNTQPGQTAQNKSDAIASSRLDLGDGEAIAEILVSVSESEYSTTTLSSETAIQQALQTVQRFALPVMPVKTGVINLRIQALATQLESQTLVLVTPDNQVLDILTMVQQQRLQEQIDWLLDHQLDYQSEPEVSWQPWRRVRNLLQKARSLVFPTAQPSAGLLSRSRGEPGREGNEEIVLAQPLKATASRGNDLAVRQLMATVQTLAIVIDRPTAIAQERVGFSVSPVTVSSLESANKSAQFGMAREMQTALSASAMLTIAPSYIRGIALLLTTRSLVLVTNHNESLDILTLEQQQTLRQRISWDVAHYQRYLKLRQHSIRLSPLRPPKETSRVLPPVRVFQQLMAWMQSGPVAIATNLFQEAALDDTSTGVAKSSNVTSLAIGLSTALTVNPASSAATDSILLDPSTIRQSGRLHQIEVAQTVASAPANHKDSFVDIDAEASAMGYQLSLLERVLRWLDRILSWAEKAIARLWNWLMGV
jgi:hypothetical protein